MAVRRLWYLAALLGCWIFYIAYGEWFSWLLLMAVLGLPWLSLLLSIPAIRSFRAEPTGPDRLTQGQTGNVLLAGSCPLPMPPFRGRLKLTHRIAGESLRCAPGSSLPTAHCGGITVAAEKVRVCDYLGIFSFPAKLLPGKTIHILPRPVPVSDLPSLRRYAARGWKPKFGGGFAENHELRLYRPGDNLNQVHWKLTAKTGKLILREPIEPIRGRILLTMTLNGTPDILDRKLGKLLWLGQKLLQEEMLFELRILTGEGILNFSVSDDRALNRTMDALLCTPAAREGSILDQTYQASWQYHIGGEPDEA